MWFHFFSLSLLFCNGQCFCPKGQCVIWVSNHIKSSARKAGVLPLCIVPDGSFSYSLLMCPVWHSEYSVFNECSHMFMSAQAVPPLTLATQGSDVICTSVSWETFYCFRFDIKPLFSSFQTGPSPHSWLHLLTLLRSHGQTSFFIGSPFADWTKLLNIQDKFNWFNLFRKVMYFTLFSEEHND